MNRPRKSQTLFFDDFSYFFDVSRNLRSQICNFNFNWKDELCEGPLHKRLCLIFFKQKVMVFPSRKNQNLVNLPSQIWDFELERKKDSDRLNFFTQKVLALRTIITSISWLFFEIFDLTRKLPSLIWETNVKQEDELGKAPMHNGLRSNNFIQKIMALRKIKLSIFDGFF